MPAEAGRNLAFMRHLSDMGERTGCPGREKLVAVNDASLARQRDATGGGDATVWHDLKWFVRALKASPSRWRIFGVLGAIVVILIGNMTAQVFLNRWNGQFFDSISAKNLDAFIHYTGMFFVIAGILLALVVAQTLAQELLKIELRRFLTVHIADMWLQRARPYQLAFAGAIGSNPDQRVQEDTRKLAEFTAELATGLIQQTFLLTTFVGVLWNLSSALVFRIGGADVTIPGYMVWCAMLYAFLGSALTFLVGKPLIVLNAERSQKEAELRFALVRLSESAESIGFLRGEGDERRGLNAPIGAVLGAMRAIAYKLARLTWVTSGYGWLSLIVPVIVAAPAYFTSSVTFGGLMRLVDAFGQVQASLRWFVDNFAKIADWRAALFRVMRFEEELRRSEIEEQDREGIRIETGEDGALRLDDLRVALPGGAAIIAHAALMLAPGERAQLSGPPGSGKSTLLRAIAGLWPWGAGSVTTPPEGTMMFLPPRPYLPLGTLREAVCYPGKPEAFGDGEVRSALRRCGLESWIDQLDVAARWDRDLTTGDQQRLTFARLMLHRPALIFMDEATSALDEIGQADLFRLFDEDLATAAILLVSHRGGFEAFASRRIVLDTGSEGSVLKEVRPASSNR